MNKYESLMNKSIQLQFNKQTANTFHIIEMTPSVKKVPGFEERGYVYDCKVKWEKKIEGSPEEQVMGFDEQTLNDLLQNKKADCPGMPMLKYRIIG